MKPHNILIFIIITLIILLIMTFIFPKEGIKINENFTLEFITINDFFDKEEQQKVQIVQLKDDSIIFVPTKLLDSAILDGATVYFQAKSINIDSVVQYIEFPENNKNLLDNFFSTLVNLPNTNDLIHILHYGDSQIEVDRMSSYIRYRLQVIFGGSGPGYLPAIPAYNYGQPMQISYSDNWTRYTCFPTKDSIIDHNRFGISGTFAMFTKYSRQDSILNKNTDNFAWLKYEHSAAAFQNVKIFNKVRMFYGHNKDKFILKMYDGDIMLDQKNIEPTDKLDIITWNLINSPANLRFEFSGTQSPEIYGISFDAHRGVALDNIALRGCAGDIFTRMDINMLSQMYNNLNVKLFILQFGGNRVPYDYDLVDSYVEILKNQIYYIRQALPNVPIIVIGPADKSEKVKDEYLTHVNLIPVRDAVRKAALESNCAFWDTFVAMGGENSMANWVFNEPPLAEKDFTHFNHNGAKIIAKMFYEAFIFEYNNYINNNYNK